MYMQHLRYEVVSADRDNILQFLIPALCVCIQCSSHWLCNGFCWNELCCLGRLNDVMRLPAHVCKVMRPIALEKILH